MVDGFVVVDSSLSDPLSLGRRLSVLEQQVQALHVDAQIVEAVASMDLRDCDGRSLLHIAASKGTVAWGQTAAARRLLEAKANIDHEDIDRCTPLFVACRNGHRETAAFLLEKKAAVDHRDKNGWTPLHSAACWGPPEIAALLIQKGALVNCMTPTKDTPLHIAALNGNYAIVNLLLQSGVDRYVLNVTNHTAEQVSKKDIAQLIKNFRP